MFEALEPRLLLAVNVTLSGNDLHVTGDDLNNAITLSQSGSSLLVSDPNGVIADTGSGVAQLDARTASVPIASLQATGDILVDTLDGIDSVSFGSLNVGTASVEVRNSEEVSVQSASVVQAAGGIDVEADTVKVLEGATLSTRQVAFNDPLDGIALGNSRPLKLVGRTVEIQSGASLLAHVESGSAYTAGNILIQADLGTLALPYLPQLSFADVGVTIGGSGEPVTIKGKEVEIEAGIKNDITSFKRAFGFTAQTATVDLVNSTIEGETVSILAESEDFSYVEELPEWVTANFVEPVVEFLTDKFLPKTPIAAMYRAAESKVKLDDVEIRGEGDVTINANSTVDASVAAVAAQDEIIKKMPRHLSAGYSQGEGTSQAVITGDSNIEAGGSVSIGTDATTTAKVTARTTSNVELETPANPRDLVASLAITNSSTKSHVNIDEGVTVAAEGNVNVLASGKVTNKAQTAANTYIDGLGGLSVSLAFDDSDVQAVIDGQLIGGGVKVTRDLDISEVDGTDNTITIPGHGFDDGQRVQYFAIDPDDPTDAQQPIGGLVDGETLRVIVIDDDTIQLARTTALDIDNADADPAATQTLSRRASVIFDPQAAVNPGADTITLAGHGFTTGQRLDYGVGGPDDDAIGGLIDQNSYYVISTGPDTFQLAVSESAATAATPVPIDLTGPGIGTGHIVAYDEPSDSFSPVSDVDGERDTITIPDHGYATGDGLVFRTDPNISSRRTMTRTAAFNPADVVETFDPTGTIDLDEPVLNPSTNTLALVNHGLDTGDEVTYLTNGGDPIDGLTGGANYFVIKVDDRFIQLALTATDAADATAIDLEAGASIGGGPQQLVPVGGTPGAIEFDPTGTVQEPVLNAPRDTIFINPVHDLVAGQRVTYSAGGGTPIGNLLDNTDYFAIPVTNNTVRLAATRADALAGAALDLAAGATGTAHRLTTNDIDVVSDLIISPGHELETGQQVTYRSGDGAAIGNLTDANVYYAIRLDANTVRLASSLTDAAAGSAIDLATGAGGSGQGLQRDHFVTVFDPSRTAPIVDVTADTIELPDHGLSTSDGVNYQASGGTPIGGLADNTNYFVIAVDGDHVQLAASAADAATNTPLDLSGGATLGSGYHALRVIPEVSIPEFPDRLIDFDPTLTPSLDIANNAITLRNHKLATGEQVTYLSGAGTPVGGLGNGTDYYVIVLDEDTVQLAANATDASNGVEIPLAAGATGDRHGLERLSTVTQGDVGLRGLTDGETYFAVVLDDDTIRLAPSNQDALASVAIDLDPSVATGDTHELKPLREEDGISVAAELTADNRATSGAGLGSTPTWSDLLTKAELQGSLESVKTIAKIGFAEAAKKTRDEAAGTGTTTNDLFSGAAGLSLNIFEHDVKTLIGKTAVLQSDGDVGITASTTQKAQVTAQGNASPGSGKKFATGVAASLGFYDNSVQTIIDGDGIEGATIDANFDLKVTAELDYPLLVEPLDLLPFSSFFEGEADEANVIGDLSSLLNGSLGLTRIMNVWSASKVFTTNEANLPKVSVSGSLGLTEFDNQVEAVVRSGARLNQNQQTTLQDVRVEAATGIELVNVTGIMHLRLNEAGLKKALEDRQVVGSFFGTGNFFSFFGNKSSTFGMGGSAMVMLMDNRTTATIEDGAVVHSGLERGLTVEATEDVYSLEFAQSGGDSGSIGISGSLGLVEQQSETIAHVASGVQATGGPLEVRADSQLTHFNLVGAAQLAKRLGIGVGVAVTDVDRQTAAVIGNLRTDEDESPGTAGTAIDVSELRLEATNSGNVWSFSLVGALASNIPQGKPVAQDGAAEPVRATSGVALAGDAAVNTVTDVTQAYVNDEGTIAAETVEVSAGNDTSITTATGAATFALKPDDSLGGSLAGSFSYNALTLTTDAFIAAAELTVGGDVSINATNEGEILAISAGLAGALAKSDLTIAGSFSWNEMTSSVRAYVDSAVVEAMGELGLTADDKSRIQADAGGASIAISRASQGFGGAIAFGVSAAINNLDVTANAVVTDSTITAGGARVESDATPSIEAVTWAGALAGGASDDQGLAVTGAGAGSGNTLQLRVEATVTNSNFVISGPLALNATDDAEVDSNAGGVAVDIVLGTGGSNFGVPIGAAAAVNELTGDTTATITGSSLTAGNTTLSASSTTTIDALSIGIGAALAGGDRNAVTFAGAGAGSGNTATRTAESSIVNSTLSSDSVTLAADDATTITADGGAGAAALAGSVGANGFSIGFGAAVATNGITNTAQALLDNSTITAAGAVAVSAAASGAIETTTAVGNLDIALSDGGVAVAFGGAGAGSGNAITNSVIASIRNGSRVTTDSGGDVTVTAADNSTIDANAGAGALAAEVGANSALGFSAGAAAATNDLQTTTRATIDSSHVDASGQVHVTAESGGTVDTLTIGVGGALSGGFGRAGIAFAGGGAGSGNTLRNTLEATVEGNATVAGAAMVLSADDNSAITADAGAGALAAAGGGEAGVSVGIGAAIAVNDIANATRAAVDSSSVTTSGNVAIGSSTTSSMESTAAVGALSGSGSGSIGVAGAGAGASSQNLIQNTTTAEIIGGTAALTVGGTLSVSTGDGSTIDANAGAGALAATGGTESGFGVSIGAALVTNTIQNTARATIDSADVTADGNVSVTTTGDADVDTLALGIAGGLAIGGTGGAALDGAGAGATNTIDNTVEASIKSGATIDTGGTVDVAADDTAGITADAGGVAAAISGGTEVSASVSVGASVAVNTIGDNGHALRAHVDQAQVQAGGGVNVNAASRGEIEALAFGGAAAVSISEGGSVAATGAGASATNTVSGDVDAAVVNGASVVAGGDVSIASNDLTTITANAVGGSLSISGSAGGSLSVSVSAALAENEIQNTVRSRVDQATLTTANAGDIAITTTSTPGIDSLAVAATVSGSISEASGSFSGGGANSTNTVRNQVDASVSNSSVTSAGGLTIATTEDAALDADVGSGALAFAVVGASVAVSETSNTVDSRVAAYVADSTATATSGNLNITAHTTADNRGTSVATSVALSLGGAGFGGDSSTTDSSVVEAYAQGARIAAAAGTVTIASSSEVNAQAESYGVGGGLAVIGVLLSDVSLQRTTRAYAGSATRIDAQALTVEADAGSSVTSTTLNGDISGLGGEGARQTAADQSVVEAYLGPALGVPAGATPTIVATTGSGGAKVTATLESTLDVESDLASVGALADGVGAVVEATVTPTVRAFVGEDAEVDAAGGPVSVEAAMTGTAGATGFGLGASAIAAGGGLAVRSTLSPQLTATAVGGSSITGRDVSLITRLNVDESNNAPLAGTGAIASGAAGTGALFSGAGSDTTATVAPTITTTLDAQSQVHATDSVSGGVTVASYSFQSADAEALSETVSGVGVGVTLADAAVQGSTTTRADGTVDATGRVTLSSVVASEAMAYGEANGFSLLGSGDGTNVTTTIGTSGQTMVETAVAGQVSAGGDVTIESLVTTNAHATSSGLTVSAGVSVAAMPATTTVEPEIGTAVESGASVSSSGGDVMIRSGHNVDLTAQPISFLEDKQARVESTISSGSLAVNVDDTTIQADARAVVDASLQSSSDVSAPSGDVSVLSYSSNRAEGTMSNSGGAAISYEGGDIQLTADGTTTASAAGSITGTTTDSPGAVNVRVSAQASDLATGDLDQSGGGVINVGDASVTSTSAPTVSATLDGTTLATSNVTVSADSFTDADGTIRASSGGVVDVEDYDATVNITPRISAELSPDAVVVGGQTVQVVANHGQPADLSGGTFDAANDVNTTTDEITFKENHGLQTGSTVTYDNLGQPDIGGLENGRDYGVIVTGPTSLQLGDSFQAGVSSSGTPRVDITRDTIQFAGPHDLRTGDRVIYRVAGGTVIGGLTDGATYVVQALDATTIRLIEPAEYPPVLQSFAGTDIMTDTLTLPAHGFTDGQPVTYVAADPATFGIGQVDVTPQFTGGTLTGLAPDPSADNIFLGEAEITLQGFSAGDTVIYTSEDPAMPIGGLVSGNRYVLLEDPAKPGELQLADPAAPTVAIPLDTTGLDSRVEHSLLNVEDQPIQPLVDQQTYYVANATTDTFQLAATKTDALAGTNLITLDPTDPADGMTVLTGMRNQLGTAGVDLTSVGSGTQHLVIDVTATSTGTQQLEGIGGAQSVTSASSNDGIATASISSGGGGAIEVSSADTRSNANAMVSSLFGSGVRVLGLNIEADASSAGKVAGSSSNSGGGFISVGDAQSKVDLDNSATVTVGTGAQLEAADDILLTTTASHYATVDTSTDAGGFATFPDARATAQIDFVSQIEFQQDAALTAGGTLSANAQSDVNGTSNARADGGGVGSGAEANNDSDRGLFIGKHAGALTKTVVDSGATLSGETVDLRATVTGMYGYSDAHADGSGVGGNSQAQANLEIDDQSTVELLAGAELHGDLVALNATHQGVDIRTHSYSDCDCGAGANDSIAKTDYQSVSLVRAEEGVVITTAELTVDAVQDITRYDRDEDHDGTLLVFGTHEEKGNFNAGREIDWNATTRLPTNPNPAMVVDANGLVVTLEGVLLNSGAIVQGDTVPPGTTIIVDDLFNSQGGSATFTANRLAEMDGKKPPVGFITGSQAEFDFNRTLDSIQLSNASDRDLVINDIRVYFTPTTADQEVTIDVQQDIGFSFDVVNDFGPSGIAIENTHPTAAPSLSLDGLIDNPLGTTTVTNASGDIAAGPPSAPAGVVRSNQVVLEAPQGNLGDVDGNPLVVQLVQSAGRPTSLIADAGLDASLDVQGLLRDETVSDFQPNLDRITAGEEVLLVLREGLLQTTLSPTTEGIRVFETDNVGLQPKDGCSDTNNDSCFSRNGGLYPAIASPQFADGTQPPRTSTVETHWPPSSGDPPPPASELGLFGDGSTTIDATYTFRGSFTFNSTTDTRRVQAGDDIRIAGCDATGCGSGDNLVHVLGNVDLVGFSGLPGSDGGLLSTETNGSIDLTSVAVPVGSNRSLRVGTISSTTDSVRLTVPDTTAAGEDLVMFDSSVVAPDGSRITAASTVTLQVGDNVLMSGDALAPSGSSRVEAGTTVLIAGDFGDADPGVGSVIDLRGRIVGNTSGAITDPGDLERVALITGQDDADIVSLTNVTAGTGTTVQTNGGDDRVQVGSNAAVDASTSPPAFTNGGGVLHAVQALLTVEGGGGDDALSADDGGDTDPDSGILAFDSLTGFQMNGGIHYEQFEDLVLTLGQAGDTLQIDSTNLSTDYDVFGNDGDDTFDVGKLPSLPLAGNSCPQTADTVDCIQGFLRITGGADIDTFNLINTGQTAGRSGTLTGDTVTGLDMGPEGIAYSELEIVDILLGQAGDTFGVVGTAAPQANGNTTISAVHGGGGSDLISVTGGGGSKSPLVVYGDFTGTGTPGNDTIDASGSANILMVDGNEGDDLILGGQAGDNLAGSAGNDTIRGQGGADNILGDSGFEVNLSTRVTNIITSHAAGQDVLEGEGGRDRLFGDHAVLTPVPGALLVVTAEQLTAVETVNESEGDADRLLGGDDDDLVVGGEGDDTLFGNEGHDQVLGDNGRFDYSVSGSPPTPRSVYTPRPDFGGSDNIFGDSGNDDDPAGDDVLYDGPADDELDGGPGDDIFRLLPGNESFADGSRDFLSDVRGQDTVDFTYARIRADCLVPATATDLCGIMIDMDLLGFTETPFSQSGPAARVPITQDAPQRVPQDPAIDDRVSLLRIGEWRQTELTPSPFESVIGSYFNDTFRIEALATGGDIPENGPPVRRNVDGNPPVIGDAAVPPGDTLLFNGDGQQVLDTGFSITASGIGTVTYQSIETLVGFNSLPRIIDNGDVDFRLDPVTVAANSQWNDAWQGITNRGYEGDFDQHPLAPDNLHTATWTLHGLQPGTYRVAATWPERDHDFQVSQLLATNAPFTVFDDGNPLGTVRVDQNAPPDDFRDDGVFWEQLGLFTIRSHTMQVQLSNQADNWIYADAVRLEYISSGPEIRVLEGNVDQLTDDVSTVELSTIIAEDVTKTFTVRNEGTADLEVFALELVGAPELQLATPFPAPTAASPLVLPPGASTTFTITLDAVEFGDFDAQLRIFSNDLDENVMQKPGTGTNPTPDNDPTRDEDPFTVDVRGVVGSRKVIDNGDQGFSLLGGGIWLGPDGDGYQGDDVWNLADASGDYAVWTFDGLPAGDYRVSATWAPELYTPRDVPFTVFDGDLDGLNLGTFRFDQEVAPGSFQDLGVGWEDIPSATLLGGVPVFSIGSGRLTVQLTDDAFIPGQHGDQYVLADAVRIERIFKADLRVEQGGSEVVDDTGLVDFGVTFPGVPLEKTFTITNDGPSGSIELTEPFTVPSGYTLTEVFGGTPDGSSTITLAPGDSTTFKLRLDAGAAGTVAGEVSFGMVDPLVDPDENPFNFRVTAEVSEVRIIDDEADPTDPRFTMTPLDWSGPDNHGYQFDDRWTVGDGSGDTATWTFTELPAGTYEVAATWKNEWNSATNAPYTISDGAATLGTIRVDQSVRPDQFGDDNVYWDVLGNFTTTSGTLVVTLTDAANNYVLADAIRIQLHSSTKVEVRDTSGGGEILVDGVSRVELGTAELGDPPLTHTLTMRNLGLAEMSVGTPSVPEGFSLTALPNTIPPGGSASFDVLLPTTAAGSFQGTLSIPVDDVDENPFEVLLSGSIVGPSEIIDDGDAAYAQSGGGWGTSTGEGFENDIHWNLGSGGAAAATWTFDLAGLGLPTNGLYRVSATWPEQGNRATDSPYSVFDGTTAGANLATVRVDQELPPDDFTTSDDGGTAWKNLGGPYRITSGTLTVQLTDDANDYVIADALRVEQVFGPEIQVLDGTAELTDGASLVDFGTTTAGSPISKTFTIRNLGTATLTIDAASLSLPSGFSLGGGFTATTLDPFGGADTATFEVTFDGTTPAGESTGGTLSFGNNDFDENPFEFQIQATVASSVRIIDDGDAGFTQSGFTRYGGQGYLSDIHYSAAGSGADTAEWTFSGLAPGWYQVAATWHAESNRATDSPFGVYDGTTGGTLRGTVKLNQERVPDDFVDDGVTWEELGGFLVNSGTLTVQLTDDADQYVIADGMRIERLTDPEIQVLVDGGTNVSDGSGMVDYGTTGKKISQDRTFTINNVGGDDLVLQPDLALPAGYSLVAATPATLFDGTNTTTIAPGGSVSFEVRLDANDAGTFQGTLSFDNNDSDESSFNFTLEGEVIAALIIDDGDPGYFRSGFSSWYGGYQNDFDYSSAGSGADTASWTFDNLSNGIYRVSVTWIAEGNRATDSPFRVFDGTTAGTLLSQVDVNQRVAPDDFSDAGANWEDLGTFTITSGTLTVLLTDDANNYVIADAVRVENVSPLLAESGTPTAIEAETHGLRTLDPAWLRAASDIWSGWEPGASEVLRDVRVVVDDLPAGVLGLASQGTRTIWLDDDAAGHGWQTRPTVPASRRMDLLTVVTHELGHVLGYPDLDPWTHPGHIMSGTLAVGERRVATSDLWTAELLDAPRLGGGANSDRLFAGLESQDPWGDLCLPLDHGHGLKPSGAAPVALAEAGGGWSPALLELLLDERRRRRELIDDQRAADNFFAALGDE